MDLNYDPGDKLENLRRMNHFEKFNKANIKFIFAENNRFFEYYEHIFWLYRLEIILYD